MTAQLDQSASTADQTFDLTHPVTGELVGTFPVHTAEDVARRGRQGARGAAVVGRPRLRRPHASACSAGSRGSPSTATRSASSATARPASRAATCSSSWSPSSRTCAGPPPTPSGCSSERRVAPGLAMVNFDARLSYQPLGVAGVIAPWNFPIYTVLLRARLRAGRRQRRRRQAERVQHGDRRLRGRVVLQGQPGRAARASSAG